MGWQEQRQWHDRGDREVFKNTQDQIGYRVTVNNDRKSRDVADFFGVLDQHDNRAHQSLRRCQSDQPQRAAAVVARRAAQRPAAIPPEDSAGGPKSRPRSADRTRPRPSYRSGDKSSPCPRLQFEIVACLLDAVLHSAFARDDMVRDRRSCADGNDDLGSVQYNFDWSTPWVPLTVRTTSPTSSAVRTRPAA